MNVSTSSACQAMGQLGDKRLGISARPQQQLPGLVLFLSFCQISVNEYI